MAEYIDWFNDRRRHGAIGMVLPVAHETYHQATNTARRVAQRKNMESMSPGNPLLDKNGQVTARTADQWCLIHRSQATAIQA